MVTMSTSETSSVGSSWGARNPCHCRHEVHVGSRRTAGEGETDDGKDGCGIVLFRNERQGFTTKNDEHSSAGGDSTQEGACFA